MNIVLDDDKQILSGEERITYFNNSPDSLEYLWIQLDQNMRAKNSDTKKIASSSLDNPYAVWNEIKGRNYDYDGGFKLEEVKYADGKDADFTVNKTMMRLEVPGKLAPGNQFEFSIK